MEQTVYTISIALSTGHDITIQSATEPIAHVLDGKLTRVDWTPFPGSATVVFIAWDEAVIVSWERETVLSFSDEN